MPGLESVLPWIEREGYVAIFGLLVLGVLGMPLPDEWLLLFTGYLVQRHELALLPALGAAFSGAAGGITLSYLLGRAPGRAAIDRWGAALHLGPERLDRVRRRFDRWGLWLLTFGFFLPGVRHLTAIGAGISGLRWKPFALYAYGGALLWTLAFVAAGYWLGESWRSVAARLQGHLPAVLGLAALLATGAWLWRRWR